MRRSTSRTVSRYWLTLRAIGRAELAVEPRDVLAEPIEQAGASCATRRGAFGGAAAFAEQTFEDDARMRLGRQRRRGRRPGKIVLINAGVAVVALADRLQQSIASSSEGSCVSWPICCAAI